MIFNLSTMLVVLTISSAPCILAVPHPEANHFEARGLLPRHANILDSRLFRRSRLLPDTPVKRAWPRKNHCHGHGASSTSSCSGSTTTTTTTPAAAAPPTTVDTSTTDPSPPQDTPMQNSTTTTPTATPAPSSSDPDTQAYLDAHNNERAKHGASPLTWASDLAGVAQSWANGCVFQHSQGQFGENLAAGSGTSVTPSGAVQMWNDEASDYNPSNPQYSHWTQVVWKGTTEVGCAVTTCPGEAIFGTSEYGTAEFYVCEYRPAGNVIGEFAQNVQA